MLDLIQLKEQYESLVENDEISPEEEAFLVGYIEE